ncbi:Agglutinin-like protein 7 [Candida viswanathii]|uniref:Agglutinin-like protein 7 n=1 Tax=Candida viswanathii TaxID=5486 RepID=A0A367YFC7_9ASCO|nr:Agglutinin-like protein 7 [Candida viswanathii]
MSPLVILCILLHISLVATVEVYEIFTRFVSITKDAVNSYSFEGPVLSTWIVTLGWEIDGTRAMPGDTFTLEMPCVYRIFIEETTIDLLAQGVSYATCDVVSGEESSTTSYLRCTMNSGLQESSTVDGILQFPVMFNAGGSASAVDLEASTCFTSGTNTITFIHGQRRLSIQQNFAASTDRLGMPIAYVRTGNTLDDLLAMLMAPACEDGYATGKLTIAPVDRDIELDCTTQTAGFTTALNAWHLPTNSRDIYHSSLCTSRQFAISYSDVGAGYRPFLLVNLRRLQGTSFNVRYTIQNMCQGESFSDRSRQASWKTLNYGVVDSYGDAMDVVSRTRTGTMSTTLVTTRPFNPSTHKTKTIQIYVPIPTTTITTSYLGATTSISTVTAPTGGTATIIVNNPYHATTTLTTYWTGARTTTTTQIAASGSIDTVFVQIPSPNPTVTRTEFWTGSSQRTLTQTNPPLQSDVVLVQEPRNPTVTITTIWTGSSATTETQTNGPQNTDTIIVYQPPNPTTTVTSFWMGTIVSTQIQINGPQSTDTVVIYQPPNPTTTITTFGTGSVVSSQTQTNGFQNTDTVIVYQPRNPTTTITSLWTGSVVSTETQTNDPQNTDTIIIYQPPNPTTTITSLWTGSSTSTETATNTVGNTDTVIVYQPPNPTTTITTFWTGSVASTQTQTNGDAGIDTVVVYQPRNPTTTISTHWTGALVSTQTQTNQQGSTDTVIIYQPQLTTPTGIVSSDTVDVLNESSSPSTAQTNSSGATNSVAGYATSEPTTTRTEFWSAGCATEVPDLSRIGGATQVVAYVPRNPTVTTTSFWPFPFITTVTSTNAPQSRYDYCG